ncbi:M14 family zinc carboxypeptidase [Streptomyces asoensis]|uniref:M14 family zinc carboxypeptidase n=1 Tax=Streptomyces asoensis TaxID=249586 RepID=UPI003715B024
MYLNVDEVESAVTSLAAAFPAAELIELPEPSIEGRACHALRIGTGAPGAHDAVVLTGGVHAREWGSCEILVDLAADLLEAHRDGTGLAYGGTGFTAAQVRAVVDGLDVVVFPLVNPDGRHYSQTVDPMWRKNRNPARSGGDPAGIGVDINRNFDFLFDFGTAFHPAAPVRVSADPADPQQVYQGPSPFSEPETRNVRGLLDLFPRTRWFVDVHSYSQDMLFVWGDDDNQSLDPDRNFRNPAFDGKRGLADDLLYGEFVPDADTADAAGLAEQFCRGGEGRARHGLHADARLRPLPDLRDQRRLRLRAPPDDGRQRQDPRIHRRVGKEQLPPAVAGDGEDHPRHRRRPGAVLPDRRRLTCAVPPVSRNRGTGGKPWRPNGPQAVRWKKKGSIDGATRVTLSRSNSWWLTKSARRW